MNVLRNIVLVGKHGKPVVADAFYIETKTPKPVIIFSHGFKGFKDWGHFNLAAEAFARAGFLFVKFNFSHNGTSIDKPDEFVDLEAFGNNNFQFELDDLGTVIDFVSNKSITLSNEINTDEIYLIGHSRGGGISILKANKDPRIKKIITWASVNEFGRFINNALMEQWKKDGVLYIPNSRTGQDLPMYYAAYKNQYADKENYGVENAARKLTIPFLIVHGTNDTTVAYEDAVAMHSWNKNSELLTIEAGDHVFSGKHPWTADELPEDAKTVVKASIDFLRK